MISQEVNGLKKSLQREFEFFAQSENFNEQALKAKKRQIKSCEFIESTADQFSGNDLHELIFKLEACLIFYGVSPAEIQAFMRRETAEVKAELKRLTGSGTIQVPFILQQFIQNFEAEISQAEKKESIPNEPQPARYAKKPVIGLAALRAACKKETINQ